MSMSNLFQCIPRKYDQGIREVKPEREKINTRMYYQVGVTMSNWLLHLARLSEKPYGADFRIMSCKKITKLPKNVVSA